MITSADLTEAEWGSLRELRNGPLKRQIPLPHQDKLINLGLAKKMFMGIAVTDFGRRYRPERDGVAMSGASVRSSMPHLVVVPIGTEPEST